MRGNLQKIMIGLVVVIVLAFIFFSGDSLVKLVDTIKQGTPFFIIAAVVALAGFAFTFLHRRLAARS